MFVQEFFLLVENSCSITKWERAPAHHFLGLSSLWCLRQALKRERYVLFEGRLDNALPHIMFYLILEHFHFCYEREGLEVKG